jgi:hypothetical protein
VLALLAGLTLAWGTNWSMFSIALSEPVLTFRTGLLTVAVIVLYAVTCACAAIPSVVPATTAGCAGRGLDDEPHGMEHRHLLRRALPAVGPRLGAELHHAALSRCWLHRVPPAADAGCSPPSRSARPPWWR